RGLPEREPHRRTVPSQPPEARNRPEGAKATALAGPEWPRLGRTTQPRALTFHRRTVPSPAADASSRPSGLKATPQTYTLRSPDGLHTAAPRARPVRASQRRTLWSRPDEAKVRPVPLNATPVTTSLTS